MKKLILLALVQVSFLLLTACGGSSASLTPSGNTQGGGSNPSGDSQDDSSGSLVSSKLLATKSASFFRPYAVNAYKIVYNTKDTAGSIIKVSGLLSIPKKDVIEKSPFLSYQHGTIFLNNQAPSISSTSVDAIMRLAGRGYIVSAPDYIGYGESSNKIHPYIHADSLASASIDMLKASKEFLQSKSIKINNQLFLAGYSEGGYATLALQKAIQEKYANEFTVTASAAGAGPFDLTETAKTFANKTSNQDPSYISFLIKAYDSIYGLNKISEIYQPQYVNVINTVFDGEHSGSNIDSSLTKTTASLFKAPFLSALQGAGNHVLKDKLALNNIYDWKPISPTRFYHGPNDQIVPYSNAQKALDTMTANGATDVTLGDCFLNTHVQCAIPYVLDTLDFFDDYADDL